MPDVEDIDPAECRICRESSSALLYPCRCTQPVHLTCLRTWVTARSASAFPLVSSKPACEVCLVSYAAEPSSSAQKNQQEDKHVSGRHSLYAALEAYRAAGDPLRLQPQNWTSACESFVSLESCTLLCLFGLALVAHFIYILGVYDSPSAVSQPRAALSAAVAVAEEPAVMVLEEHGFRAERLLLAVFNAVLTAGILFLVRKISIRWLRNFSSDPTQGQARPAVSPDVSFAVTRNRDGSTSAPLLQRASYGECAGAGQFVLTAILSVVAGAEVFILLFTL
jgi:hypothetical protein